MCPSFFPLLLYLHSIIFAEFISRKTVDFEMSDEGLDSDEIILEKRKKQKTYITLMQIYHFSVSFKLVLKN